MNRGPQLVHVTNGCRWRRLPGVVRSRTQSGQVATSAETRVRPAPVLDSRISKPVPPIGAIASVVTVHTSARVGASVRTRRTKAARRLGRALDLGEHAVGGVGRPAAEAELVGEGMEERPEADTLDQTGDLTRRRRRSELPQRADMRPQFLRAPRSSDVRWAQVASQARVGRADQAGEAARSWFPPCSAPYAGIPGPARVSRRSARAEL